MATKKKSSKVKKGAWFVPVRGSYLPASWQAWASYVPFVGYLIFALAAGWRGSHSLTKTILFVVPNWVAATVVMTWIAKATS